MSAKKCLLVFSQHESSVGKTMFVRAQDCARKTVSFLNGGVPVVWFILLLEKLDSVLLCSLVV